MVNGLECRLQNSQVISDQACRFRNFFLGPIPELFSASVSSHFQEIGKIMSTQLTRHYFLHFQELHEIMSTNKTDLAFLAKPGMPSLGLSRQNLWYFQEMPQISSAHRGRHYLLNFLEMRRKTCRKKFRNGAQKKVPESAGLVGGSGPSLAQT